MSNTPLTAEQQAFVLKYRPMVGYVVNRTLHLRGDIEDYMAAGMVGLCVAAQRFDPERAKGNTFAFYCIRSAVVQLVRHNLGHERCSELTLDSEGRKRFSAQRTHGLVDDEGSAAPVYEVQADPFSVERFDDALARSEIRRALVEANLSDRDRMISQMLFVEGLTEIEVGERIGITRQGVNTGVNKRILPALREVAV